MRDANDLMHNYGADLLEEVLSQAERSRYSSLSSQIPNKLPDVPPCSRITSADPQLSHTSNGRPLHEGRSPNNPPERRRHTVYEAFAANHTPASPLAFDHDRELEPELAPEARKEGSHTPPTDPYSDGEVELVCETQPYSGKNEEDVCMDDEDARAESARKKYVMDGSFIALPKQSNSDSNQE